MPRLFDRIGILTIASPAPGAEGYFNKTTNAVVIRDLRVTFTIEKSLGSAPNKATILVYNLAERTRDAVKTKPLRVILEAGYDGDPRRIFAGDIIRATSDKLPVDWETKIVASDGARAFKNARVNRSMPSGTRVIDVVREGARAMGLRVPESVEDAKEMFEEFVSGVSIQGRAEKEITRVLAPRGLSWSVQDGALQILKEDQVRPDEAVVVSEDTGMIASPVHGDPKKKGGKPRLSVKTSLDGRIRPGVKLMIQSRVARGLYKAETVKHVGDTIGGAWDTEAECKAI